MYERTCRYVCVCVYVSTLALFDLLACTLLPTSEIRCYPLVMVCGILDRAEQSVHRVAVAECRFYSKIYITHSYSSNSPFASCPSFNAGKLNILKYKCKGAAARNKRW